MKLTQRLPEVLRGIHRFFFIPGSKFFGTPGVCGAQRQVMQKRENRASSTCNTQMSNVLV